jgi:hypothetical protein
MRPQAKRSRVIHRASSSPDKSRLERLSVPIAASVVAFLDLAEHLAAMTISRSLLSVCASAWAWQGKTVDFSRRLPD